MLKIYQDFIKALNKKYQCNGPEELEGIKKRHYTFAASTNGRGLNAIGVFEAFGFNLKGLKILDVGCAYGGFIIEAAKKGAHCYGVDISKGLYDLGNLNNKDEVYENGSCKIILSDATSPEFLELVPNNYFDLIIVNDVFEHVYDTVQLLSNLNKVSNKSASIYFIIPNGNCLNYLKKEPHTGFGGLSLLKPLDWYTLTKNNSRNIYYRQFTYYKALFDFFGFSKLSLINNPDYFELGELKEKLKQELNDIKKSLAEECRQYPTEYNDILSNELDIYEKHFNYNLTIMDSKELYWSYLTELWGGFVHKKELNLEPLTETNEKRFDSNDTLNTKFLLKIKNSILSICVNHDDREDSYFYSFSLKERNRIIEKSNMQIEKYFKWNLKAKGMYWVIIEIYDKNTKERLAQVLTQPLYYGK